MNQDLVSTLQEGFYFIRPLLGKENQPGFLDCIGYLKVVEGKPILIRSEFSPLDVLSEGGFEDKNKTGISPREIEPCRNIQGLRYSYQRMIDFIEKYQEE